MAWFFVKCRIGDCTKGQFIAAPLSNQRCPTSISIFNFVQQLQIVIYIEATKGVPWFNPLSHTPRTVKLPNPAHFPIFITSYLSILFTQIFLVTIM
jgi:hypothetical protein